MEEDCMQWERLGGEFAENENYFQAANQYKHAASCYLDRVIEMTRKAAEYYHLYAEESVEKDDHKTASKAYFEAATQYRQVSDFATALTLYENSAQEALQEDMIETAAQAYLWAAFACYRLNNNEYFLECAKNMGELYDRAAEKALEEGNAPRVVIDLSLAAMGLATIERTEEAKDHIEKAKRVINKTSGDWLETLLNFSQALAEDDLDTADDLLREFKEEETIQQVMRACLDIRDEEAKKRRRSSA